jgi:hypothetical protein
VAPAAPKDVTPTPTPAIDPTPVVDESEEGYVPPGPSEEETVAAWLTSNLAATGRAVDESAAARGAGGTGDVRAEVDDMQRQTPQSPEAPWTRAAARAASGHQSEGRRRSLIVGLVLVLVILVWYLLLRG